MELIQLTKKKDFENKCKELKANLDSDIVSLEAEPILNSSLPLSTRPTNQYQGVEEMDLVRKNKAERRPRALARPDKVLCQTQGVF